MIKKIRGKIAGLKKIFYLALYKFFSLFKIKDNKVVIVSYYGKGYGDNSKYVVEKLLLEKKYEIIWLVRGDLLNSVEAFPAGVRTVKYESILGHLHLATAKVWLDNCRKPWYVLKRKNQFYIQLWHGSPALKRIEADAEDKLNKYYLKDAKTDSEKIDLFISNCKWFTDKIPGTFWYSGKIAEVGLPRNDIFFKDLDFKEKVESYFNKTEETRTLLYAPTFRNAEDLSVYDINFKKLIEILKLKTGENWIVLVRLHPNISDKSEIITYDETILDASKYPDLQELIAYSDMLITDYSSVMFDFSLTRKPIFLYCNDYDDYKKERDVYFEVADLPFYSAFTFEKLKYNISNFDNELYQERITKFFKDIDMNIEGNASEKVVDIIKEVCQERKHA